MPRVPSRPAWCACCKAPFARRGHRARPQPGRVQPYLLLITPGAERYARERREVTEACATRGLPMISVLSESREVQL